MKGDTGSLDYSSCNTLFTGPIKNWNLPLYTIFPNSINPNKPEAQSGRLRGGGPPWHLLGAGCFGGSRLRGRVSMMKVLEE